MKKLLKTCIAPLLVVCSLHVLKIIEFYLCIQMLPSKMYVGLTLAGPPVLVLIEIFLLAVTAEELPANIGSKSAISLKRGLVDPKFQAARCRHIKLLFLRKIG